MLVKKSNKLKRLFIILFLTVSLFFVNIGLNVFGQRYFASAATNITNGEFDTSSTSALSKPTDYVEITGAGYSNNDLVTAGIANLNSADYLKYKGYLGRTNADESKKKYALFISSTTKRTIKDPNNENNDTSGSITQEVSHSVKYGYKTSSSISLDKNSFYQFSVFVNTSNRDGIGNFALLDADDNDNVMLIKSAISTPNNLWYEYSLLVATDNINSLNVKPALILNGNGDIMFDCLSMQKISEDEFISKQSNPNNASLDKRTVENEILGKDLSVGGFKQENDQVKDLVLNFNKSTTTAEFKRADNTDFTLTFNRHLITRVIVKLKTENFSGSASLKLSPKGEEESDSSKLASLSISGSEDYTLYEFWIKSSVSDISDYVLKLDTTDANGKIYFRSVSIQNCTSAQFSSATTGDKVSKLDLASSTTSSSPYVSNGEFNTSSVEDALNPYPLKAENWTFTQTGYSNNQYYGIVNLADGALYKEKDLPFAYQLPTTDASSKQGNVLVLYPATGELSAFSSVNTLSSGFGKFSLNIYTLSTAKVEVLLRNNNTDCSICSFDVNTTSKWQNVSLCVKAADASSSLVVKISAGAASTTFIDDVKFETTATESDYNSAKAKADLSNLINPDYYTTQSINLTVIDAESYNYNKQDLTSKLHDQVKDWNNKKALRLSLNEFGMGSVSTKIGFNLTSGYYQLSLSIHTDLVPKFEDENVDYGLKISFSGYENNTFENVTAAENYITYTYYINASAEKTSNLTIEFGNDEVNLKGEAFIGNIKFSKLDYTEQQFGTLKEDSNIKILANAVEEDEDTSTDTNTTESKNKINWRGLPYLISSILFALSIIVAVVGIILRKVKFKKPAKKTKNEYDRNKTVSKQYYARKALQLKEEKLSELNSELAALTDERTKYEETYKADLSKLREMKIRRADKSEINKLEKDLKQNQKASASIGVNIARVENDIAYVNSAAYMASITKRLESEAQQTGVVEEVEDNVDKPSNTAEKETKPKATKSKAGKTTKSETAKKKTTKKSSKDAE